MDEDQIGIHDIKSMIIPNVFPRLLGQASYSGKVYHRKGDLIIEIKESKQGIKFTDIRLVIKVDDKIISEVKIPNEAIYFGYEINKKITLGKEEVCNMIVIATDSIGLEHHYTVDRWVGVSDTQREPWFEEVYIFT